MRDKFLPFGAPIIEQPEIDEVVTSLKSGWLASGKKVEKFEEMFREYKDAKYAIAVNSCTAALHLSVVCLGLEKSDEVIMPSMTYAPTANAIIHAGGKPILADCNRSTMNITPEEIEKRITQKTKAIIPVHFAGRPCEMDEILDIAKDNKLKVIEDCAHAIEAEYKGKKAGTFGDLGCFSFYANKNITTGEGGMIVTNSKEYAYKIRTLRYHGLEKTAKKGGKNPVEHSMVTTPGFKYTMMDIQAAIGIHQLPRIDEYWKKRKKIWEEYNRAFSDFPIFLPAEIPNHIRHSYHLYILLLDIDNLGITRDEFLNEMTKRNIGVGVHYIALHLHPYYKQTYGYKHGDFPNAEWISDRTVSIPLSANSKENDVRDVINTIIEIMSEQK